MRVAKSLIVRIFLLYLFFTLITFHVSAMQFKVETIDGVQRISAEGTMNNSSVLVFQALIMTRTIKTFLPTYVVLNSGGGNMMSVHGDSRSESESRSLAILFNLISTQTGVPVYSFVSGGSDSECSSMCLVYYTGFHHRAAAPDARFGLHSPSYNGIPNSGLRQLYFNWLEANGVKRDWLNRTSAFLYLQPTYLSATQMLETRSKFIEEDNVLSEESLRSRMRKQFVEHIASQKHPFGMVDLSSSKNFEFRDSCSVSARVVAKVEKNGQFEHDLQACANAAGPLKHFYINALSVNGQCRLLDRSETFSEDAYPEDFFDFCLRVAK